MKVVVLSGAGISAESGIATFRDSNGLWEGHDVMEVASPEGWKKNNDLVLDFYNQRRRNAQAAKPNIGHLGLRELEDFFEVAVVTQNVDDLHERAGSTNIIHLHGELFKAQSTKDPKLVYDIEGTELNLGDKCELGAQLRPFIVWFGEAVPMIEVAIDLVKEADVVIVVGTSMNVYPAAGLIDFLKEEALLYVVDPKMPVIARRHNTFLIEKTGTKGLPQIVSELKDRFG